MPGVGKGILQASCYLYLLLMRAGNKDGPSWIPLLQTSQMEVIMHLPQFPGHGLFHPGAHAGIHAGKPINTFFTRTSYVLLNTPCGWMVYCLLQGHRRLPMPLVALWTELPTCYSTLVPIG